MSMHIRSLRFVALAAPVVMLVLTGVAADGDTIYVCWDGSGDYVTIQEGINAATDGDEVVVCDGTYTGPGNKNLDFHGKAITVRSASGDPDLCIIDCEGSDSDPHRGFYLHSGETAVVDGFTITNGYSSGHGGGVCCEGVQATITNCTISSNQAGCFGGGVYCDGGQATITNCTISGNQAAEQWGGGVFCFDVQATLTNCTISTNAAGFAGGGVCGWDASLTITDCTISSNEADIGGGVCCFGSETTVANCTISGNQAVGGGGVHCNSGQTTITNCTISGNSGAEGGGVSCYYSSPTLTNCTISSNEADIGGGVHCADCSPSIANCTIADNAANGGNGGGIYSYESPVVTNCLITGNTAAGSGGGLCCDWSFEPNPTLTNCTFAHNAAAEYGGAVYCFSYSTTRLSMTNCILWADLAAEGAEIALEGDGMHTVSYSDVQGGEAQVYVDEGSELIWGEGNIDADPLFVDPDNGEYRLSASSPCIDAACNWAVPPDTTDLDDDGDTTEYTPLDLDGEGRFFDDPNTDDTGCACPPVVDMGAYEFGGTGPQPCPGDLDCDRMVGQSDLGILLAAWGDTDTCDLDCDGDIDQSDLGVLLAHWGEGCP